MARSKATLERSIADLVPSEPEAYEPAAVQVPVYLESSNGVTWANTTRLSLESMTVELAESTELPERVSFYCELPVRAALEGKATVTRISASTWVLRFTHLTPKAALALRALTRSERVRRTSSSPALKAIAEKVPAAPARPSARRPSVTLSKLALVVPPVTPHGNSGQPA